MTGKIHQPARISMAQAAFQLGVSEMTIRRMIARGTLPAYRIGSLKLIRIEQADIDLLLQPIEGET